MKSLYILCICVFAIGCSKQKIDPEDIKQEILQAETEFDKMANEVGIKEAFIAFAADDAVLNRNRDVVVGKAAIAAFYENQSDQKATLTWKPDFVDVSASGDLGYTYGKYTYVTYDSLDNSREIKGIFHTVWKRQDDGSWKYVYD